MSKTIRVCRARAATSQAIGPRAGISAFELAVMLEKQWPQSPAVLTVSFMDTRSVALRRRVMEHLNAWSKTCGIRFRQTTGHARVRIARFDSPPDMAGYWSYEGTDILEVPVDEPTMNLEGFTARTSEREFRRVVRHEAGHTLGFPHEHMRRELVRKIDARKAIRYFKQEEGWTAAEVREQVLTPIEQRFILGTRPNPQSIMCYQVPGEVTKDGRPIVGGADITDDDFAFAATVYPK